MGIGDREKLEVVSGTGEGEELGPIEGVAEAVAAIAQAIKPRNSTAARRRFM